MRSLWLLACALVAACYQPEVDGCRIACTSSCPGDLICGDDGLCHVHAGDTCPGATITIDLGGEGRGKVERPTSCPPSCQFTAPIGQTITLHAAPDAGKTFDGWTGPCSGSSTTCSFVVDQDDTVGATFGGNTILVTPPPEIDVVEGETAGLNVSLADEPQSQVTVDIASDSPLLGVAPSSIAIPAALQKHELTVQAIADDGNTVEDVATLHFSTGSTSLDVPITLIDSAQLVSLGWPTDFGQDSTVSTGTAIAYRLDVASTTTLHALGVLARAAGGSVQVAIYSGTSNAPDVFMYSIDPMTLVVGANQGPANDIFLAAGTYWLAVRSDQDVDLDYGTALGTPRCTTPSTFTDAWPNPFAAQACGTSGTLNLYAVTF